VKKYFLFLVFIFGCFVLLFKLNEQGNQLLSLEVPGDSQELISTRSGELIKGDIVRGKIKSRYSNLGQITIRFNNNHHDSDDIVLFKIKEEGNNDWYYQVKIKTDQFQPQALFPFGFPQIKDSIGKTYVFEVESLNGQQGRGISIDSQKPQFTAKSIFAKNELISNKKLSLYFIFHKILDLRYYPSIVLFSYYPFVFLLFLYYYPNNKINFYPSLSSKIESIPLIKNHLFSTLIILMIVFSLIFGGRIEDINIIFIVGTYLLYSKKYKYESRIALFYSVWLLILALILLIFGQQSSANSSAVWAYMFLWITVVQQIGEDIFHFHPTISLEEYLSQFGLKVKPKY